MKTRDVFNRLSDIGGDVSPFTFAFGAIVAMFFIFVAAKGELGTYIAFFTFAAPAGTPAAPMFPQLVPQQGSNPLGQYYNNPWSF